MKIVLIVLGWMLLVSYGQAQSTKTPTSNPPTGYLYQVTPGIPGKAVYVCGEHPFDASGNLVAAGDLSGQTRQVLENIKTSLARINMKLTDVTQINYAIKGTSTTVSASTIAMLTKIGASYFTQLPKLVDVKSTPKIVRDDVLIVVEVVAIK